MPTATPSFAQSAGQRRLPVVRDAEIESLVRDYASPILKAAGLSPSRVEIVLVNDLNFNAFVAGRRIFINTGTLLDSENPNETIGVIATRGGPFGRRPPRATARSDCPRADHRRCRRSDWCGCRGGGAASGSGAVAGLGSGLMTSGSGIARSADCSPISAPKKPQPTAPPSPISKRPISLQRSSRQFRRADAQEHARWASRATLIFPRIRLRRTGSASCRRLRHESPFFDKKDSPDLQLRHDFARAKIARL